MVKAFDVADEAHAFDAVDAAFGGFVGVPAFEPGAGDWLDVSFFPECYYDVDVAYQLRVNEFGLLAADIDTVLREDLRRQFFERVAGLGAGRMDLHNVAGDLAHQSCGHL
jgi:hypothetical protein